MDHYYSDVQLSGLAVTIMVVTFNLPGFVVFCKTMLVYHLRGVAMGWLLVRLQGEWLLSEWGTDGASLILSVLYQF